MRAWIRTFGTLTAAVVIGGLLTTPFLYESARLILGYGSENEFRGASALAYVLTGSEGGSDVTVFRMMGILEGVPALLAALLLVGVAFRREWARESGAVVFSVLGVVATFVSLGGVGNSRAPHAVEGFVVGLVSFVVAGLLMVKPTADAVMWHQHRVDTRKHARAYRKAG